MCISVPHGVFKSVRIYFIGLTSRRRVLLQYHQKHRVKLCRIRGLLGSIASILIFILVYRGFNEFDDSVSIPLFVAAVLDFLPHSDSILACSILSSLSEEIYDVNMYVREMNVTQKTFKTCTGRTFPVVFDTYELVKFHEDFHRYDIIFSSLWFWDMKTSPHWSLLPVSKLVSTLLESSVALSVFHVMVTEDIHYLRCIETSGNLDLCREILKMETKLWEDPFLFKIFATFEDQNLASEISRMHRVTSSNLPHILKGGGEVESSSLVLFSRFSRRRSASSLQANVERYRYDMLFRFPGSDMLVEKDNLRPVTQTCLKCSREEKCLTVCCILRSSRSNHKPVLSVYTTVQGTSSDRSFLQRYIADVLCQDLHVSWELIIATASRASYADIRKSLFNSSKFPPYLTLKLVLLQLDDGLYETWDDIISFHTHGKYLMNWNVDDRKHKSALRWKLRILTHQAETLLVSSTVLASRTPNQSWEEASREGEKDFWYSEQTCYYGMHAIFQRLSSGGLVSSYNLPHNSPMYHRDLHAKYGRFSDMWQGPPLPLDESPTCSDFHFWSLALGGGEIFYHTRAPIELYYVRPDSHNRLPEHNAETCVQQVVQHALEIETQLGATLGFGATSLKWTLLYVEHNFLFSKQFHSSVLKAVFRLLHAGFRIHVLFATDPVTSLIDNLPHAVTSSSMSQHVVPRIFDCGLFFSKDELPESQLRVAGYFVPRELTLRVSDEVTLFQVVNGLV